MAIKPTVTVEWEFDPGVWTAVSGDVVAITTRRGRNRELGAYETGSMTITLRNEDRDYDPDYAAGPYYGKLRPNRRVRFRATYNAVTYPVFVGYVDRITQRPDGPNALAAVVDLSDRFKILNRAELPPSVYAAEVATDEPTYWFRLGDPAGSAVALDSVQAYKADLAAGTTGDFGAEGLISRDDDSAFETTGATDVIEAGKALVTGTTWTIEMVLRSSDTTQMGASLFSLRTTDGSYLSLRQHDGFPSVRVSTGTSTVTNATFGEALANPAPINNGSTHHVALRNSAGTMSLWVDGALVSTGADASPPYAGELGRTNLVGSEFVWLGIHDEIAFYDVALDAARIAAHADAVHNPWDGDLPGERLERVLALAGVDPADYDVGAGTTELQGSSLGGTLLGYAQRVEQTDLGAFFVAADGTIRFVGREELAQGDYLVPVADLADDPPAGDVPYRDVAFEVDEADVYTRATVSRDGSAAFTYTDTAAFTEFGPIDYTAEGLFHGEDSYSRYYAEWIVNTHRTPASRISGLRLSPSGAPTLMFPALLGLELTDRVTLTRRPPVGAAITGDFRVESIAHQVGTTWETTLELSPFDLGEDNQPVFIWDETTWDNHVWGL